MTVEQLQQRVSELEAEVEQLEKWLDDSNEYAGAVTDRCIQLSGNWAIGIEIADALEYAKTHTGEPDKFGIVLNCGTF